MMKIQILGPGCHKCKTLMANTQEAIKTLGIEAQLEKVDKIPDIIKFGVMTTPAIAVDGKVMSVGKVLSPEQVAELLKRARL